MSSDPRVIDVCYITVYGANFNRIKKIIDSYNNNRKQTAERNRQTRGFIVLGPRVKDGRDEISDNNAKLSC